MFTDVPRWIPFVVAPTYIGIAVVLGTWWIHGRTVKDLRWAIEGGPPTQDDLRNTLLTPWRIALSHLVLWGGGAVLLTVALRTLRPAVHPTAVADPDLLRTGGGHHELSGGRVRVAAGGCAGHAGQPRGRLAPGSWAGPWWCSC